MRFPRNFLRWEGLKKQGGTCTILRRRRGKRPFFLAYTALGLFGRKADRWSDPVCRVDGVKGVLYRKT